MEKIVLFGNGQVADHAYVLFTYDSPYEVVAFTVDRAYLREESAHGLPIVPFEEISAHYPPDQYKMHISISYRRVNQLRAEKYEQARAKGYQLVSAISPRATTWPDLVMGDNGRIGANTLVDTCVTLGNNVTIAGGCIIGHHTVIGDHCFLAAGVVVSGSVTIEPYCFIGANATIRDRVTIARASVVGAGACILEDTAERGVYIARQAERLPVTSDRLPLG
jgi:sugar O-acyltransferase (sialic acid O-acetyltransferase NeuD family)